MIHGFPLESRFEHTHVLGGSGHGKTQLLQQLILNDIDALKENKGSIIVIDSQGDMIGKILYLAEMKELSDRLILIDPSDIEHPPALNLFDFGLERLNKLNPVDREKLVNGAIALYEYLFGALLGAELSQRQGVIFRYLARLMMVVPGATIHNLMDFMQNPETVKPFVSKLDPISRRFFETQFFDKSFNDTRQQILTRLWGVLSNPILARMFSAEKNKIDLFDAMNKGSIILIYTDKSLLKQEGCESLGRFFIALIAQATQERAVIPEDRQLLSTSTRRMIILTKVWRLFLTRRGNTKSASSLPTRTLINLTMSCRQLSWQVHLSNWQAAHQPKMPPSLPKK